ncbi:MAG: hypothetical protein KAU95_02210 [Candidatus Aenigmarchaeota archaeon]|nr:hypothetical protein [Candidatus Aenigmarchaeota archaeon]
MEWNWNWESISRFIFILLALVLLLGVIYMLYVNSSGISSAFISLIRNMMSGIMFT